MRLDAWPALLFTALASSGCLVLALQPAYDSESVTFDERLVGQWENAEDGTKAAIERGEWRSYKVIYTDRFSTRSFQGNLTKLGDATFLDLTEMRGVDPGPYLVPVHGVLRVTIDADTVQASLPEYAWFAKALLQKSVPRLVLALDDRRNLVMTAPTAEIRRWLARAPADVFSAPMTFSRTR